MYKNLLVPVDGGDLSEHAIQSSIELAKQLGATITAFVAESVPPLPAIGRTARQVQSETARHDAQTEHHAKTVLRRFADRARDAGVGFTGHHVQALHIEDAIVAAATSHGCDMIVMATHRRSVMGELLFGAHTKGVISRSKLPVLVLH